MSCVWSEQLEQKKKKRNDNKLATKTKKQHFSFPFLKFPQSEFQNENI